MCINTNDYCLLLNCLFFPKSIVHYLKETGLVVDTVSSNILLSPLSKSFGTNTEDIQEIMKFFVIYTVDTMSFYGLWIMPPWIIACKNGQSLSRLLLDTPPGLQAEVGVGVPGWNPLHQSKFRKKKYFVDTIISRVLGDSRFSPNQPLQTAAEQ
jgi:hypothetical protein